MILSTSDLPTKPRSAALPRALRYAFIKCAAAIAVATAAAYAINKIWLPRQYLNSLAVYYFEKQDATWLLAIALLLGITGFVRLRSAFLSLPAVSLTNQRKAIVLLAVLVLIYGWAGSKIVFVGYQYTVDEVMAAYAATTFRSGMLVAAVPEQWQRFADALEPTFMLPLVGGAAFMPVYLPVNAGFRAFVGLVADPAWTSPILAAVATVAVFGVARRLWPARPDAAWISAGLLATSSQVLVMSMTSFAMTAHLALNLVWLWFFLRDDKIGHAAAITTGFFATGLHQLIFHPLFVLPFFIRLWIVGRRHLMQIYGISYIYICIFWIIYPQLVLSFHDLYWQGVPAEESIYGSYWYFFANILLLISYFNLADNLFIMLDNVLRFVVWENPFLFPLMTVGYIWGRSKRAIAVELFTGVILTLAAVFILLPAQGTGWGYRYLHGVIGNLALLAGYGWITLSTRSTIDEMVAATKAFVVAGGIACFILLPAHARDAHKFISPYARAQTAIEQAGTDLVFVDRTGLYHASGLVRNDPFLRNTPKVLDLAKLSEADIADLCARYSIGIFDQSQALILGMRADDMYKADYSALRRARTEMARLSCGNPVVVSLPTPH